MISELSRDNPRLIELTEAYGKLNLFEQSVWQEWETHIDIQNFRGEVGYMAQMWNMTEERYWNTYGWMASIGEYETLKRLGEDGSFGAIVFRRDGVNFSRDLIDSVTEIRFLQEHLGLDADSMGWVLDVGAGYGRFAHRLMDMFPKVRVVCVDGVPLSTFLCEYYLRYRFTADAPRWDVVPLDRLGSVMQVLPDIHLATNMQSFSEMPLSAVEFWLRTCADMEIPYFFLEPHSADLIHPHYVTSEPDGTHKDYYQLFAGYGYKLKVQQPKFPRDLAPTLIYSTDFLLFERG